MILRNVASRLFVTSRSGSSARLPGFAIRASQRRDAIGLGLGLSPFSVLRSRNWHSRERRNAADGRCAGRQRRRSRDKELIPLGRRRTTGHASACEGIDVRVRCKEAVRERLEEGNDLVLLRIAQPKVTNRHVKVVRNLGHWPAVYLLNCS